VPAVWAERERLGPTYCTERQGAVEVREQRAAAGWFPFEWGADGVGGDCNKNEIALPGEMFRGGLRDLIGGGKMNVAVGKIDRRADEFARVFGRLPRGGIADFVNRLRHRSRRNTLALLRPTSTPHTIVSRRMVGAMPMLGRRSISPAKQIGRSGRPDE